jgi:hypothetical protein
MLLLLKSYIVAPAFRLNPSLLPIATRRFLATSQSPDNSLSQAQTEAPAKAKKTGDKPKRCKSIRGVVSKCSALNPNIFHVFFLKSPGGTFCLK